MADEAATGKCVVMCRERCVGRGTEEEHHEQHTCHLVCWVEEWDQVVSPSRRCQCVVQQQHSD